MATDAELMEYANSRMMKYPDVLNSTDRFESEETTEWDKAFALANHLQEKGYPAPQVDAFTLATHILNKWKQEREANEVPKITGGFEV